MAGTTSYEYAYKQVKNKNVVKPLFIVKYGPPASGKNTVMSIVREYYPTLTQDTTVDADLDVIISQLPEFQKQVSPTHNKQEAYQTWRALGMEVMDDVIRQATLLPCHITFETTGASVDWTIPLLKQMISSGYRIVLMYPLVHVDKLVERAKQRERKTGQVAAPAHTTMINNRKVLGIHEINQAAIQNLQFLIPFVDDLLMIDNNHNNSPKVILYIQNVSGQPHSEKKHMPGTIKSVKCSGKHKHEWYDSFLKEMLGKYCSDLSTMSFASYLH